MSDTTFVTPVKNIYLAKYAEHGHKLESLGWHDALTAQLRLEIIAMEIPSGATVLDVGCGYGDLVPHLHPEVKYTGIDVVEPFIEHAQALYPGREFGVDSVMRFPFPHDYVVASGTLAFYDKNDAMSIVRRMWDLTKDTLIFNVFSDPLAVGMPIYSIDDYAWWIKELGVSSWKIEADYLPNDATLYFFKNKAIMHSPDTHADSVSDFLRGKTHG